MKTTNNLTEEEFDSGDEAILAWNFSEENQFLQLPACLQESPQEQTSNEFLQFVWKKSDFSDKQKADSPVSFSWGSSNALAQSHLTRRPRGGSIYHVESLSDDEYETDDEDAFSDADLQPASTISDECSAIDSLFDNEFDTDLPTESDNKLSNRTFHKVIKKAKRPNLLLPGSGVRQVMNACHVSERLESPNKRQKTPTSQPHRQPPASQPLRRTKPVSPIYLSRDLQTPSRHRRAPASAPVYSKKRRSYSETEITHFPSIRPIRLSRTSSPPKTRSNSEHLDLPVAWPKRIFTAPSFILEPHGGTKSLSTMHCNINKRSQSRSNRRRQTSCKRRARDHGKTPERRVRSNSVSLSRNICHSANLQLRTNTGQLFQRHLSFSAPARKSSNSPERKSTSAGCRLSSFPSNSVNRKTQKETCEITKKKQTMVDGVILNAPVPEIPYAHNPLNELLLRKDLRMGTFVERQDTPQLCSHCSISFVPEGVGCYLKLPLCSKCGPVSLGRCRESVSDHASKCQLACRFCCRMTSWFCSGAIPDKVKKLIRCGYCEGKCDDLPNICTRL